MSYHTFEELSQNTQEFMFPKQYPSTRVAGGIFVSAEILQYIDNNLENRNRLTDPKEYMKIDNEQVQLVLSRKKKLSQITITLEKVPSFDEDKFYDQQYLFIQVEIVKDGKTKTFGYHRFLHIPRDINDLCHGGETLDELIPYLSEFMQAFVQDIANKDNDPFYYLDEK